MGRKNQHAVIAAQEVQPDEYPSAATPKEPAAIDGAAQEEAHSPERAKTFTERTYERVQPLVDAAAPYVDSVKEKVQPYVDSAKENVAPYVEAAKQRTHVVQHCVEDAADRARGAVDVAKHKAHDYIETAKHQASPYVERAVETVGPYVDSASAKVSETKKRVSELRTRVIPQEGETRAAATYRLAVFLVAGYFTLVQNVLQRLSHTRPAAKAISVTSGFVDDFRRHPKYRAVRAQVLTVVDRTKPAVEQRGEEWLQKVRKIANRVPGFAFLSSFSISFVKDVVSATKKSDEGEEQY